MTSLGEARSALAVATAALDAVAAEVDALRARVAELEASAGADPDPPPPTVPAEPDPTPWVPAPPAWARYSAPGALRVDRPMRPWPRYAAPQRAELDLVLSAQGCRRAGSTGPWQSPRVAYQQLVLDGALDNGRQARVGVIGKAGAFAIGGAYSVYDPASVVPPTDRASMPVSVALIGLTEDAEAEVSWGHNATVGVTGNVSIFDLGLRGARDAFAIRAVRPSGHVTLDGVWLLANESTGFQGHTSGLMIKNFASLLIRGVKWRGAVPGSPGIKLAEHWCYGKTARADAPDPFIIIAQSDLRGGNRTCSQVRPGIDEADLARPRGDVMFVGNFADGFGWNHPHDPAHNDGGAAFTAWAVPDDRVFMLGNRILDARYACLGIEGQGPSRDWVNAAGYPIGEAHVAGNFVSNPRATRDAMSFGAIQRLCIYDDNVLADGARITLNSKFNADTSGIRNGRVELVGGWMQGENYQTWDAAEQRHRPLTAAEIAAMRV